jgi:hypothetical protein
MSETGVVCLPSLDTWYQVITNVSDLDFWSDFVEHRQHYGGGQKLLMFVAFILLSHARLIKNFMFVLGILLKVIYHYQ